MRSEDDERALREANRVMGRDVEDSGSEALIVFLLAVFVLVMLLANC